MIAVRMMQMSSHQVIDVIAVGNRLMAAAWAMNMPRLVAAAVVRGRAGRGIALADCNRMLCRTAVFLMAQAPVVQIINVSVVLNLDMPASGTVLVIVFCRRSLCLSGHDVSFPVWDGGSS